MKRIGRMLLRKLIKSSKKSQVASALVVAFFVLFSTEVEIRAMGDDLVIGFPGSD